MQTNRDKNVIDFSDFYDYQVFSDGYYWMSYEETMAVIDVTNKEGLGRAINSPMLLNIIGTSVFNMPYILVDGEYTFIIPVYSDTTSADIEIKEKIGDIIKVLSAKKDNSVYFSNKTKFILYNDKIVVENVDTLDDANIVNIVYNVITLFLLQTLRRGQ